MICEGELDNNEHVAVEIPEVNPDGGNRCEVGENLPLDDEPVLIFSWNTRAYKLIQL